MATSGKACLLEEPGSPAVDAGHPAAAPDPDGTRADAGAFYLDQRPVLEPLRVSVPGGLGLEIRFAAFPNRAYSVEYADALVTNGWQTLATFPAQPALRFLAVTNEPPADALRRFYRVLAP